MPVLLPSPEPGGQPVQIDHPSRIVLIGANGSGKTRLGIWLDVVNRSSIPVHRISAQKALSLPEHASPLHLEQAEKALYFGRSDEHAGPARKDIDRWGQKPATHLLSDYDNLLSLLFAKEADRDRKHTSDTRAVKGYVPVPDSPIDTIEKLWRYLMPHRQISLYDGKVIVGRGTANEYHAREMSDGERVALYLLGQCLAAPQGSVIVIDEPEIHLHRAVMDKLWDKVEELTPDKTIVYITHDLDFAASRVCARKIWVKSYTNSAWTWSDLPQDESLPESLVLEIVGSRKPILFCEGEKGGIDHTIYQLCYPEHHVVPRGSGEKVSEAVKAMNGNATFHTFSASGIVDRDVRTKEEIESLAAHRIYALPFAEVENLLCNELIVKATAKVLSLDSSEVLAKVSAFVADALSGELETQVSLHAARRIRYFLSCYSPASNDISGVHRGVADLYESLNVEAIVSESSKLFQEALESGSLDHVLRVYNRKTLVDRISVCLGLQRGEFKPLVLRLLKSGQASEYIRLFRQYLPEL